MKRLVVLTFLFLCLAGYGQSKYFIIKIKGKIENKETGKFLKQGDIISTTDQISFKSKRAKLMLISENRTKFLIEKPKRIKEKDIFIASDLALAIKSRAAMITRSGGALDESDVSDLKNYFGEDIFTIIGDTLQVPLNQGIYPLNNEQFIVFYYNISEVPVTKKIGFQENRLNIEKEKLIKAKNVALEYPEFDNVAVYRYNRGNEEMDYITEFELNFINKEEVISEFKTLIPILQSQEMDRKQIKTYMKEYYYDFYGITDKKYLEVFTESVLTASGI